MSRENSIPSLEEQDIAEKYVLFRPLPRPGTDIRKGILCFFAYTLSTIILAALTFPVTNAIWEIQFMHHLLAVSALTGLCSLRTAVVGCIRLYQHYAPERVRRKCLFRPTCSEYAILAIRKYGVIIGFILTVNRLLKKCRGSIFRIDYP